MIREHVQEQNQQQGRERGRRKPVRKLPRKQPQSGVEECGGQETTIRTNTDDRLDKSNEHHYSRSVRPQIFHDFHRPPGTLAEGTA